ncbi:PAP2 superfamily protein [Flavobacterium aquidurense]|uniref:Phosphatidic acid phosphatase type 2/haloperoxidase domain-containing protein n=1 Tax=Flavobacterium frigidimaris TaxID=262320 RepID=A0ABX4BJT1_FLAFR|nr:phosphatase PAP2 family protein [Flavobacterium frigidimaris]OXA74902.1 hypothetical protein B0A65_22870 [Flavobacterium frigidimaris]SDZ38010.1 PAP2 superfamily protein [Flavobacterium aquidurense]
MQIVKLHLNYTFPYLFLFLFCFAFNSRAQYVNRPPVLSQQSGLSVQDSIDPTNLKKPFFQTNAVKIGFVPVLFFTASALTWDDREKIRETRNRYIPTFDNHYDNYLQYVPAASVYALNLAGVKGRNNLKRASISYAASIGIMAILVNSIKYTAKVERPDGSNNNSFPSGHSANAFMNATFLHKEYGELSPMYSISGYTMSTFTALGRELNNRHWISDVLAGAGIGILSTQLAYFFVDKFYKNDGDHVNEYKFKDPLERPSYLSLKMGYAWASRNLVENFDIGIHSKTGFEMGLEGAYYFNNHWGIGSDFSFVSFPISTENVSTVDPDLGTSSSSLVTESIGALNFTVGPHFTHHIAEKWLVQAKLGAGVSAGATGKLSLKIPNVDDDDNYLNNEFDILVYKPATAFKINTGLSFTYMLNSELGLTAYSDYNYSKPNFTYTLMDYGQDMDNPTQKIFKEKDDLSYIAAGLRITAFF